MAQQVTLEIRALQAQQVALEQQDQLVLTQQCLAQRVLQALQGPQEPLELLVLQEVLGQQVIQALQGQQGLMEPLVPQVLQALLETQDLLVLLVLTVQQEPLVLLDHRVI